MSKRKRKNPMAEPETLAELLERLAPPSLRSLMIRMDDLCEGENCGDVMLALTIQLGGCIWNHKPKPGGDFDQLQQVLKNMAKVMLKAYPAETKDLSDAQTDGRIH